MSCLSINVNKIASLRNARAENKPCLISSIKLLLSLGLKSLTVHPRPDGRHILYSDVLMIKKLQKKMKSFELNIEAYPSKKALDLILKVKPDQYTLVPDQRNDLTSNKGWDLGKNKKKLEKICLLLKKQGIRSSLFIDPLSKKFEKEQKYLEKIKPDRVEFFTKAFAKAFEKNKHQKILKKYQKTLKKMKTFKIDCNAGHDLNLVNLKALLKALPELKEVSIGHAFISEALMQGLKPVFKDYQKKMK